jgi:hypothetical protein
VFLAQPSLLSQVAPPLLRRLSAFAPTALQPGPLAAQHGPVVRLAGRCR